ncbi:terminase family protein [Mesorhizobium sp. WSM4976]|uniref:terminase large subunit domain-containing protein n=1 Tax=Mesorhizobium sp. WSM4976 TaxID=3038549 RepID=UPI002416BD56|nr:terminase family protein [Mesorhizobium sp. WSM4976]MDG4895210.1 terminase family protein [Mesorhizobium sp. WSM4976]
MSRHVTFMTINDAGHYSPQQRAEIIAAYPEHEREARAKGIPVLGSGRIFPVAEELIACEPFKLPRWWPRIGALDSAGTTLPPLSNWPATPRQMSSM